MKRLLLSAGTLLISVLLSLLAAEFVVRVVRPQPRLVISPGGFYVTDPPGRYRLAPGYRGRIYNRAEYDNEIRINAQGLRGAELDARGDDTVRLLAIGDSFVFGVGVEDEETFAALVAEKVRETGRSMEALNAGIPAFGVPDAVSWLARHGLDLEPDVVVLSIFQGNDLVDASPDREEILIVDGLLVPGRSDGGLKAWLHRHSHFYVLLKSLLEQPGFLPLRERLGLSEPWKMRVLREEFGVYRKTAARELAPAIEATRDALGNLVALGEEHGFAVAAMLIPSEIQVDTARWQAGLASLDLDPAEYSPEIPTEIFKGLLNEDRIPTLDLGPIFADRLEGGETLYFRLDRHWTTKGHAVAARALGPFLAQLSTEEGSPGETAMTSPGEPKI